VAVRGDSYWLIAKRFNISLEDLLNANGATKTDILRIGQEVQIPVRKSVSVSFTNHVVRRGETLSSIAREYSTSVAELRGANELPDDQLRVGQQIVIPVGNAVTVGSLATSQKSAAGHETCEYVVRRGDTLSRIAAENGMSTKELIALNGIKEPNHIREGQRLIVRNNPAQQASTVELPKKAAGTAQINSKQPAAKRFDDDLLGLFDDGELFNVSN
jgi:LysM repeat protein